MIYLANQKLSLFYINEYLVISEIELEISSIIEKNVSLWPPTRNVTLALCSLPP